MTLEDVKRIDQTAQELATKYKSEYITLEHLFVALLKEQSILEILKAQEVNLKRLKQGLKPLLNQVPRKYGANFQPVRTRAVLRIKERAIEQVTSSGRDTVNAEDLLVAMFEESDSQVVFLLQKTGVTRLKLMSYLSDRNAGIATGQIPDDETILEQNPLEAFTINVTDRVKNGKVDPLIGRKKEIFRISCILGRRKKNNPILVGEAGVGKTAIVDGLAHGIIHKQINGYPDGFEIFSLDMAALMAGTIYRGMVEKRLNSLLIALQEHQHAALFIDEIHMIVGAGAPAGNSLDIANLLKPMLASGEIFVIGATTPQEYKQYFQSDKALNRRFQKVHVQPLTSEQTIRVLEELAPKYEAFHQVVYPQKSLELAVGLADRYIQNQNFPDKAIDIIDEAGALLHYYFPDKTAKEKVVSESVIHQVIASMANIPANRLTDSQLDGYKNLGTNLKQVVFGQNHAIDKMCDSLILSRSGLVQQKSPIGSFLCVGPPGVGKTSLATSIADNLDIHFERFDMSEYMEEHTVSRLIGSPPGYEGHHKGGLLTEAINKNPHTVLLLDEIEKAHPKIYNIFLQIMDYGTLTDSNGLKVDFKNVILIMTSNVGSAQKRTIGINSQQNGDSKINDKVKEFFSAEFRNRLTDIIFFHQLDATLIGQIVEGAILEMETTLKEKNISFEMTADAKKWLATNGFETENGARPVKNLVKSALLYPISKKILLEGFKNGAVAVSLDSEKNELALAYIKKEQ